MSHNLINTGTFSIFCSLSDFLIKEKPVRLEFLKIFSGSASAKILTAKFVNLFFKLPL